MGRWLLPLLGMMSYLDFETLDRDERMSALAHELDRDRGAGTRIGIGRFESLLEAVGLGGAYPSQLGRNIYEMQQVRNVFAHRRGISDQRFVNACPQLGYSVGQAVRIDRETWIDFTATTVAYAGVLLHRVQEKLGLNVDRPEITVSPIRYRRRRA